MPERPPGIPRRSLEPRRDADEVDRVALLWQAKWAVLGVAALVAAVVYAVSQVVPATYESSSLVRVAVQRDQSGASTAVTAANDLASQYTQLVAAGGTLEPAARRLRTSRDKLASVVSGRTVAAQNLIQISARGDNPTQAAQRANVVARTLRDYIATLSGRQADQYGRDLAARLKPLNRSIARARRELAAAADTQRADRSSLLSALLVQKSQLASSSAATQASSLPSVDVISQAIGATQVAPRPALYAGVAFVVAALLAAQLAVALLARRRRTESAR